MRRHELITLPLRTLVLLFLLLMAYYLGDGALQEVSRNESPQSGVVAKYTRNGRPWRIFYDRDHDGKWDMWIDERVGPPYIVSIDDNRDGFPDRDEDEFGTTLSPWLVAELRTYKTFIAFVSNSRQVQYTAIALMVYTLLEFAIRSATLK